MIYFVLSTLSLFAMIFYFKLLLSLPGEDMVCSDINPCNFLSRS